MILPSLFFDWQYHSEGGHAGPPLREAFGTVIQWFKTMTTNAYIHGVKESGWPGFRGRVWQRGYYEHIISDEGDLKRIWAYIKANPFRWDDEEANRVLDAG